VLVVKQLTKITRHIATCSTLGRPVIDYDKCGFHNYNFRKVKIFLAQNKIKVTFAVGIFKRKFTGIFR